mgnify:CR=1 FL=1
MFHPLEENLSQFTTPQIEDKLTDLSRKYTMTRNPQVQSQMITLIEMYRMELSARYAKEMANDGENGLDNLINVS